MKGLTSKEAEERLEKYGPNEIKETNKISPLKILLRQIKNNTIIYLLVTAMIISFAVEKTLTAYTILLVITIVIGVGFIQEYRAEKSINALKNMLTAHSVVLRDGKEQSIPTTQIVPGDTIILRSGEKIPADCTILESVDLLVNEAVLTGESKEVAKKTGKNKEENHIYMGTYIVNGKCTALAIHTGMSTKFGKIAKMISAAEKPLLLQKKVNTISKYLATLGIIFSALTAIVMIAYAQTINQEIIIEALIIFIAVAVASFPEGFPVVLITALAGGAYKMAKKNAIVNRMSIIETLGETTVICTDKTGTITKGEMTVIEIYADKKYTITGTGYNDTGEINGKIEGQLKLLIKTAALCNDSTITRTGENGAYNIIGTPTEAALLIMAAKAGIHKEDLKATREEEIPFSSERKIMTTVCLEGKQQTAYVKGALEIVLEKCTKIQKGNTVKKMAAQEKKKILELEEQLTTKGYRALAFACKQTNNTNRKTLEKDLTYIGLVAMEDPPREEIKESLEQCEQAGIKVKMITGDNKKTAISIAKQIGLDARKVVEGKELDKITDEELVLVAQETTIFARVRPEHKLRIVKALKAQNEIVTMTGDGVNDAPALKESHIGVAMGKNGTDVTRSAADLTLKDDNFATIVDAIKEGRTIFTNIQKFLTYQISINLSQVSLIFLAILIGLPLPLIALQILFMNLFTDELTAITLAFNPYSKDVMKIKPRKTSNLITKPLLFMLALSGLIMSLGSLLVYFISLNIYPEQTAKTIAFATMVLFGITNAFNFRSFRKTTLTRTPFTNKYLVLASLIAIVTTIFIIYNQYLNKIFSTTPLGLTEWIIAGATSLSVIVVFDLIKALNEKRPYWTEDLQEFK